MADYAVNEGSKAPEFRAESSEGGELGLQDFLGEKNVVLYFYPKDNTSGCTKEAVGFNEALDELAATDTVVVGVSKDSIRSHGNFRDKYDLRFPLLSDPDRRIIEAYDVWREKKMYGKTSMGIERSTFLIDKDGVVRKAWRKVRVKDHVPAVVAAAQQL